MEFYRGDLLDKTQDRASTSSSHPHNEPSLTPHHSPDEDHVISKKNSNSTSSPA